MNIYKIFTCLLIVVLSACDTDDFLDQQPTDEISTGNYWNTEDDAVAAVNAIYVYLGDSWWRIFLSAATDDSYAWSTWPADVQYVGNGSATTSTSFFSHFWSQNYNMIAAANYVLDNIDQTSDISDDMLNRLKGEARALRAYGYQQLIGFYGDVPLIDHVQSTDEFNVAVTAREDVADFIVAELTEAAELLPVTYDSDETGRITQGAALALKARVLLYESDWSGAAVAAKEVMDLGVYSIDDDYISLFDGTNKESSEILMAAQYLSSNYRNALGTWLGGPTLGGWSEITPLQSLVDAYEMTDGMTIDESPLYDPENPFENRDPRLALTVILPGGVVNGSTIDVTDPESVDQLGANNASFTGYYYRKYVGADLSGNYDSYSYNDEVLMRYAEVLLTYAEAKIESNSIDQTVYDAINAVRQRTGVEMPAVTSGSQEELRVLVRRERHVEFALEEHRLFDIRRWEIAEDVMPGKAYGIYNNYDEDRSDYGDNVLVETRVFSSKYYLWPKPQNEMDLNENLEQTEGWN